MPKHSLPVAPLMADDPASPQAANAQGQNQPASDSGLPTILSMTPHAAQTQILESTARFRVVACGRRWGKTVTGQIAALRAAYAGQVVWWIAPTYGMSNDVWRELKEALEGRWKYKKESEREIGLASGGRIRVRSGDNPNALRGSGLDLVILDEAAFMKEDVWTRVIRPALADRRGRALFLSSPHGKNWFWRTYGYGVDPERADWASWQFPTSTNPRIPAEEIDSARNELPEFAFRQEYLAEFLDDAGGVFRNVAERATVPLGLDPVAGHAYIAGVDWGNRNDFTVIAIYDMTTRQVVALDRFNQIGWALQRDRIKRMAERWTPYQIWAEENSMGDPLIEALRDEGLPMHNFITTSKSKQLLIQQLALALENDRKPIYLIPDPVLIYELQSYQGERVPGGGWRYGAPSNAHDDTVIAVGLAYYGAQYGAMPLSF